jgi:DNA-directed RNA polymerase subunit RPC12/RpoP
MHRKRTQRNSDAKAKQTVQQKPRRNTNSWVHDVDDAEELQQANCYLPAWGQSLQCRECAKPANSIAIGVGLLCEDCGDASGKRTLLQLRTRSWVEISSEWNEEQEEELGCYLPSWGKSVECKQCGEPGKYILDRTGVLCKDCFCIELGISGRASI